MFYFAYPPSAGPVTKEKISFGEPKDKKINTQKQETGAGAGERGRQKGKASVVLIGYSAQ